MKVLLLTVIFIVISVFPTYYYYNDILAVKRESFCNKIDLYEVAQCLSKGNIRAFPIGQDELNITFLNYTAPYGKDSFLNTSYIISLKEECEILNEFKPLIMSKEDFENVRQNYQNEPEVVRSFMEKATSDAPSRGQELAHLNIEKRSSGKYFETCAIIGSSANLLNARQGQNIDQHEAVIRFNVAPTRGYEKDVGSKTTIRVMNDHRVGTLFREHEDEVLIGTLFFELNGLDINPTYKIEQLWPDIQASIEEQKYARPLFYLALDNVTSSGYMGIQLGKLWCEEVTIYGFGIDPFSRYSHYYLDKYHSGHQPVQKRAELLALNCTGFLSAPDYFSSNDNPSIGELIPRTRKKKAPKPTQLS